MYVCMYVCYKHDVVMYVYAFLDRRTHTHTDIRVA